MKNLVLLSFDDANLFTMEYFEKEGLRVQVRGYIKSGTYVWFDAEGIAHICTITYDTRKVG